MEHGVHFILFILLSEFDFIATTLKVKRLMLREIV